MKGKIDGEEKTAPVVLVCDGADADAAAALAEKLGLELTGEPPESPDATVLRLDADGLSLVGEGGSLRADFTRMLPRLRQNNLGGELLVKAARLKGASGVPTAVDGTAGFGEDSLLLAAAGFSVRLYEYNPVIAVLLRDGMRRAALLPELEEVMSRMTLFEEDSVAAMPLLESRPDVILLDPMFPKRQKSALIKKKFQLLHLLESPCSGEEELLEAALAARPGKIVIKRPLKGPFLAGRKPSYSLRGKAVRYDCLVSGGVSVREEG